MGNGRGTRERARVHDHEGARGHKRVETEEGTIPHTYVYIQNKYKNLHIHFFYGTCGTVFMPNAPEAMIHFRVASCPSWMIRKPI